MAACRRCMACPLQAGAGQVITVIGPNGAGKSTLLNAIMGVHPGRGAIRFAGRDITHLSVEARVHAGMSLVPEKRELFGTLAVEDNLRLGAFRHGPRVPRSQLDEIYALFPPPAGAPPPTGQHPVRRRAPDARHRPRADGAAPLC